jgi:hypothetical protein
MDIVILGMIDDTHGIIISYDHSTVETRARSCGILRGRSGTGYGFAGVA